MTDEASQLRRKMMSEQELRDWNVREGEIFANLVRGARPPPPRPAGDPPAPPPSPPALPPPLPVPPHARLPWRRSTSGGVRRGAARAVGARELYWDERIEHTRQLKLAEKDREISQIQRRRTARKLSEARKVEGGRQAARWSTPTTARRRMRR